MCIIMLSMKQNNSNEIGKANNWALINGGYGVFGESGYDYYDPRVAELIAAYGRQSLSKMQSIARDLKFKIVYGDTDSLFLDNPDTESLAKFQGIFNRELDIEL